MRVNHVVAAVEVTDLRAVTDPTVERISDVLAVGQDDLKLVILIVST